MGQGKIKWRERRGSNPQPPDRQSGALTNCATPPRKVLKIIIPLNALKVKNFFFLAVSEYFYIK